jgi:hypothetical protein
MFVVRYVGVSEAMSVDGRNAVTLTNFDPAFFAFDTYPKTWPLALIGIFESDSQREMGATFNAQVSLYDPEGRALLTMPSAGTVQSNPYSDLPLRVFFGVFAFITFPGPGDYRLELTLNFEDESVTGERIIHVRERV